jgi:hypothetical protein
MKFSKNIWKVSLFVFWVFSSANPIKSQHNIADLVITDVAVSNDSLTYLQGFSVNATLINSGTAPADFFINGLYISPSSSLEDSVELMRVSSTRSLNPNQSKTITFEEVFIPDSIPAGVNYLMVVANIDEDVYEDNMNNNISYAVQIELQKNFVGTSMQTEPHGFRLFPNPAADLVHLEIDGAVHADEGPLSVYLFAASGRMVYQDVITESNHIINVTILPPGTYFFLLKSSESTWTDQIQVH